MNAPFKGFALDAPRLLGDFETRSRQQLGNKDSVGAHRYAQDPSTQIICFGYKFKYGNDQTTKLWTPWEPGDEEYEVKKIVGRGKNRKEIAEPVIERVMIYRPDRNPFPEEIIEHIVNGGAIEAHNAAFEFAIFLYILATQFNVPMPTRWVDTMAKCAYLGLPLGLDDVGKVLNLDTKKMEEGKAILQKISKPRKPTKSDAREWNNSVDLFEQCFDYCMNDVDTEDGLGERIGDMPAPEYRIWTLDQRINNRGIALDFDAVHGAIAVAEQATRNMESELNALTKGEVQTGNQKDRIRDWLAKDQNIKLDNMQAGTIKEILKDPRLPKFDKDDPATYGRRVLEIRQELCRTSTNKLYRMVDCVGLDGRIRGLLQYHGAGTGRWAGRLVQPQNFPRPKIRGKPFKEKVHGSFEDLIALFTLGDSSVIKMFYGNEMETIAAALRGMFVAGEGNDLIASDFSSIEARVVLWLAGQTDAMQIFEKADRKEGPDIYCHLAGQIYNKPVTKDMSDERQLGKIGVLGCGYQMSGERLQEQAHDDYELDLPLEQCNHIVKIYRETFYEVPKLWRGLENAACQAVITGKAQEFRGIVYETTSDKAGNWLTCRLPSGRRIWYFNPHITWEVLPWERKKVLDDPKYSPKKGPKLWYEGRDNKRGGSWGIITTYGGMLTENVVQAIARDCMVEAMIRAELAGYHIVLTVHDEVVSEIPQGWGSQEEFDKLMAQVPLWAPGLPIAVEGWRGHRYRKG